MILNSLTKSAIGVNSLDAFEFLMWWMLTSAKSKRLIRRLDAVQKLTNVGKFLEGRTAFHSEWYRSIVPLREDQPAITVEKRNQLSEEFYRGGRVRFEHVLAGIDVSRTVPLTKVHHAFRESQTVIVHSASGQGKTTLAFRYVKEFAPASFRLQLQPAEGLKHARQIALAIREHSEALSVPTLVYIDVRPGDTHWVELVRNISSESLIRVLVTIREEDWQRTNASTSDFQFTEVRLEFDEQEARSLYPSLLNHKSVATHIDFEDAWTRFGPRKTLLEFVYFVTQAESLTDRIKAQVRAFRDEVRTGKADPHEESLLRLVAIASTFEARLDLARTMNQCGIASPIETLRRFEEEYFLRESNYGRLLEGYHAIRSDVLGNCLTDPVLFPWGATAAKAVPLMDERDLEAFLLCAFNRRPEAKSDLLNALDSFEPMTWTGICAVASALMWLGLQEYWFENRELVDEASAKHPGYWWLLLDWDVGQVCGSGNGDVFKILGHAKEKAAALSQHFRHMQTDKARVFARVRRWLSSRQSLPAQPKDQVDWVSVSQVMFWCGHLKITSLLFSTISADSVSQAIELLPLYLIGDFMQGMREAMPQFVSD